MSPPDTELVARGRPLFEIHCAKCHDGMWNVGLYKSWFRDGHAKSLGDAIREEWDHRVKTPPGDLAAIEAYARSRVCTATAYDRFAVGDHAALDAGQQRGLDVFFGKGGCLACHAPPSFSSATSVETYENLGVGDRAYRPPTLRDVGRHGPYLHDGSMDSLDRVVRFMASGGGPGLDRNPALVDRHLTETELRDLEAFLHALDCPRQDQ